MRSVLSAGRDRVKKRNSESCASGLISTLTYTPDQIVLTLIGVGTAVVTTSLWVALLAGISLLVVSASYCEVIREYPHDCDRSVVNENLGHIWSLGFLASRLWSCVLAVAVPLAIAVRYVKSFAPQWAGREFMILAITLTVLFFASLNRRQLVAHLLRPLMYVYLLVLVCFFVVVLFQFLRGSINTGTLMFQSAPFDANVSLTGLSGIGILGRAFTIGCVTLTGIGTVVNGVSFFQQPRAPRAIKVLLHGTICVAVFLFLILIMVKMVDFDINAHVGMPKISDVQSYAESESMPVMTKVVSAVFGGSSFVLGVISVLTVLLLILAAQTAWDEIISSNSPALGHGSWVLPSLSFQSRISIPIRSLVVAITAMFLIFLTSTHIVFLINMYLISVLVCFAVSQGAMVAHWNKRLRQPQTGHERRSVLRSRIISAAGFTVIVVILVTAIVVNIHHGSWIPLVLILLMFLLFVSIRYYFDPRTCEICVDDSPTHYVMPAYRHIVILFSQIDKATQVALEWARNASPLTVQLVCTVSSKEEERFAVDYWKKKKIPIPLTVLLGDYHNMGDAVASHVENQRGFSEEIVEVFIPTFTPSHRWQRVFYHQFPHNLTRSLQSLEGVVSTEVRWRFRRHPRVDARAFQRQ